MSPGAKRAVRVAAQIVLTILIVYFVYRAVSAQLAESDFLTLEFSPVYLVASWLAIGVYYLLFAGGLALVIRSLGYRPRYRDVYKLSFAANLGKYIPGGIWQVAGKVAMARRAGVEPHALLVAAVVESAVSVTGGTLLFLGTTLLGAPLPASVPKWPLVAIVGAILIALTPQIFARVVALGMRVLKIAGEPPHLKLGQIIWLTFYYAAIWVVAGAGFWLFTRSLAPDAGAGIVEYGGFYAAASIAGLLVLWVPSGLGVREAFLVLLMRDIVSGGSATAWIVVLAARVWSTAMELVLSGIAVALPFTAAGPDLDVEAEPEAPRSP